MSRMVRALLPFVLVMVACGNEPRPLGTLIVNALVYDGSGGAPRVTSVRIVGERIDTIGELRPEPDEWFIDGAGLALAPGAIELRPGDGGADDRDGVGSISRGVTTMVLGVDGHSPMPIGSLFARLDSTPIALNTAAFAGLASLRAGGPPDALRSLLFAELDGGALGLSAFLEPGDADDAPRPAADLVDLARSTSAEGGRLLLRIDRDSPHLWDQVRAAIELSRDAGLPVFLHLAGDARAGLTDTLATLLDSARTAGAQVVASVLPPGPRELRIHERTGLPARALGLRDRGAIRLRAWADLVLFDTTATSDSAGIRMVWVNGDVVWENGRGGGRWPGRPIRR